MATCVSQDTGLLRLHGRMRQQRTCPQNRPHSGEEVFSRSAVRLVRSMAGWGWWKLLGLAALTVGFGAGAVAFAQSPSGALAGRLTDLYSRPISGVALTLRNGATGEAQRATSGRNGSYRFKKLSAGTYVLHADRPGLGEGEVDGIAVASGHETHVQTALRFELQTTVEAASQPKPAASSVPSASPREPACKAAQSSLRKAALPPETMPAMNQSLAEPSLPEQPLLEWPLAAGAQTRASTQPAANFSEAAQGGKAAKASPREANPATPVGLPAQTTQVPASPGEPHGKVMAAQPVSLTAEQLPALPLAGRNWQNFVLDSPPAASGAGGTVQSSPRGGEEPATNTVDGASIRLAFGGSGVGRMHGRSAALIGPGANEAAIREVQSVAAATGVDASRAASRGADEQTTSGSNRLHGQAFLLDRDNLWGAQNPYTLWVKPTAPGTGAAIPTFTPEPYTPGDRAVTWGLGAGGRFRRSRLFWFAALDSYHRNDAGVSMVRASEMYGSQSYGSSFAAERASRMQDSLRTAYQARRR